MECRSICDAEKAVSSPPMVMSLSTSSRSKLTIVLSSRCSSLVGLAREIPRCEPPRKWIRLTSGVVKGRT